MRDGVIQVWRQICLEILKPVLLLALLSSCSCLSVLIDGSFSGILHLDLEFFRVAMMSIESLSISDCV